MTENRRYECDECRDTGTPGNDDATGEPYICGCAAGPSYRAWLEANFPLAVQS